MTRSITMDQVARIRVDLLHHAELFDDPRAYVAGVEDALAAVMAITGEPGIDLRELAEPRMI